MMMADRMPLGLRRTSSGPKRYRRAFTLIEVLVVVAIIALLVAVLIPSLAAARERARSSACLSNLRSIATAFNNYLAANQDRFPQGPNMNYNYGGRQGNGEPEFRRPKPLNRYIGLKSESNDAEAFRCPSDTGTDREQPSVFDYYGTSYSTNYMLVGQNAVNIRYMPPEPLLIVKLRLNVRLKRFTRSDLWGESMLMLVGEFGWFKHANPDSSACIRWHRRPHFQNIAFMDGHAKGVWIRKGTYVNSDYNLIPFRELLSPAAASQKEVPCPVP